jgi:hypothetical protein
MSSTNVSAEEPAAKRPKVDPEPSVECPVQDKIWQQVKKLFQTDDFEKTHIIFNVLVALHNKLQNPIKEDVDEPLIDGDIIPAKEDELTADEVVRVANMFLQRISKRISKALEGDTSVYDMGADAWQCSQAAEIIAELKDDIKKMEVEVKMSMKMALLQLVVDIGEHVSTSIEQHVDDEENEDRTQDIEESAETVRNLWEAAMQMEEEWKAGCLEAGTAIEY